MFNKLIAVDLCNTIADIDKEIDIRVGPKSNPNEYLHSGLKDKSYYFEQNLDIFLDAEPIAGSIEALNYLSRENRIIYVTARPKISEFITRLWLKKHKYPVGHIFFTKEKAALGISLGVDLAIEDAPFEIEKYTSSGIEVMVKKQPYNTMFPSRFDWGELGIVGEVASS